MMQRTRFVLIAMSVVALVVISGASFGQTNKQLGTVKLGYAKMPKININSVQPPSSSIRLVLPKGVTSTRGVFVNDANSPGGGPANNAARKSSGGAANPSSSIRGLDSAPTFTGSL